MKPLRLYSILCLILCTIYACQDKDVIVQSLFDISGARLIYDDSKATKFLNVVAASMQAAREKEENIRQLVNICNTAVIEHPDCELILFGESILGWYIDDDATESYQESIAETIPGRATNIIARLADSLNIYIAFGMTEKLGDKLMNSQVLINPEGKIEAVHRKINLTPEDIRNGIEPGAKEEANITMYTINNIRIGLIVCADVSSYWLSKQLVSRDVEVVLHSMASEVSEFVFDPVARQFNAWEVFANRFGEEGSRQYSGTTYIADPAGSIRTGSSGSALYMYHRIGVR